MDQYYGGYPDHINGFKVNDPTLLLNPEVFLNLPDDQTYLAGSNPYGFGFDQKSPDVTFIENSLSLDDLDPSSFALPKTVSPPGPVSTLPSGLSPGAGSTSSDDSEFSETVLKYMTQILMEENMEERPSMFFDPLGLKDTEKSFYDVLGTNYLSQNPPPLFSKSPEDTISPGSSSSSDHNGSSSITTSSSSNSTQIFQPDLQPISQFSIYNQNSPTSSDGDDLVSELLSRSIFGESESALQFKKGLEEASKFLPGNGHLNLDLQRSGLKWVENNNGEEKERERDISPNGSARGRKREEIDLDSQEERNNKQSAVHKDDEDISELFDHVLLFKKEQHEICCETEAPQPSDQSQGSSSSNGGKAKGKKRGKRKETVDLRPLLILCAQAVSTDDRRTANELLKQIRHNSSPFGDGSQRLAHYFANALEARMAGTGTGTKLFFSSLTNKNISAADILRSCQVHLSACPLKKISIFFACKMILKAAQKDKTLHIVDFGISYGFQWPILIQKLSQLPSGPPKLRITGIEFPLPGFRPSERIEETGRRLEKYCARFNVPFEYNAIASANWENIKIAELKLDKDEVLAVNTFYRFKNLLDETVEETSPRNSVLELIRKMNPNIFIQSICNGSYNAPFFVTRFREALFHFSALYDMFDTNITRESEERMMFEREIYGREAMNVIACEGPERVERPENYKQWRVRCNRAGFKSMPLDRELMDIFRQKLKSWYHKDFVLDEDSNWMLHGWKGRITYASTCWVPA